MKLRMPRRRTWRVAIYSISFLLVLTAADMILVQMRRTIHPGYDTTRITAPLQPDGSIDYLLAVDNRMSAGVTPENNAAVLLLQAFARQGPVRAGELLNALLQQPDGRLPPPAVFRFVPIPYEASMRSVNQSNDRLLDILQKPTYQSRIFSIKQWEQQIHAKRAEQLSVWDLMNKDWPMQLFAPSMLKILQTETTGQLERRLTQLALMLAAYKSDHGEYPASLAELSPAYLATVPIDLFTGKPLIYSRVEKKYVLYSVGPNGDDDNGKKDDLVASTFVMETPPPEH